MNLAGAERKVIVKLSAAAAGVAHGPSPCAPYSEALLSMLRSTRLDAGCECLDRGNISPATTLDNIGQRSPRFCSLDESAEKQFHRLAEAEGNALRREGMAHPPSSASHSVHCSICQVPAECWQNKSQLVDVKDMHPMIGCAST